MCVFDLFNNGLVGAILGAGATYFLTRIADSKRRKEECRGYLLAIKAEVKIYYDVYWQEVGSRLEELRDSEPFLVILPVTYDYFSVFQSNAALLGAIESDSLREEIVGTYTWAKTVLDAIKHNNGLLQAYMELEFKKTRESMLSPALERKLQGDRVILGSYAGKIRECHGKFKEAVETLRLSLDKV